MVVFLSSKLREDGEEEWEDKFKEDGDEEWDDMSLSLYIAL